MEEQEAVGAGMPAGLEAVSPESDNAAEDKDPTTISKETHSAVNEETATNQEPINENDLNTKVEDSLGVNKSPDNNLESEELRENSTEDLDQIASFLESTKNDKDTEESTKEVENQEADEEKVVENNVDCESEREVDENEDGSKLNADIGENCDKVSGENVGESEGGKSGDVEESRKDDDVEQEKCEESEEVASREVHQNGPEEGPELKDEEKEEKTMLDSSLDQDKDDRGDPEFESATADVTHDDINSSQVLDPFDELLKGPSEPIASDAKSSDAITDYNLDNLDNDMDAGGIDDSGALDDDNNDDHAEDHADATDDALADGAIVADLNEGQGADEEVCLLPDTEREISEADKLKALASKKIPEPSTFDSLLSGSTTAGGDGEVEEEIHQVKGEESADGRGEADAHADDGIEAELNNIHGDSEAVDDSEAAEAEKDKEGEAEEEIPDNVEEEDLLENVIQEITEVEQTCVQCSESKKCTFRFMSGEETKYLCEKACVDAYQAANPDNTYELSQKKVYIKEIVGIKRNCSHCLEDKYCYYEILGEGTRLCTLVCLEAVTGENPSKYVITKKSKFVQEINEKEGTCLVCSETKQCLYEVKIDGEMRNICSQACLQNLQLTQPNLFKLRKKKPVKPKLTTPLLKLKVMGNATDKYLDQGNRIVAKTPEQVAEARADRERSFLRKCANCKSAHLGNDKNLSWETMDFCNESCLGKYQNLHGSHCANCKNEVSVTSLGKYCVRFGYDIRQFCCSGCLEEFKKGLKICCYCQRDISVGFEGFLAPVGDKGQFKDFCSQFCVEKFDQMSKNPVPPPVWAHCAVCSKEKPTTLEVALDDKSPMRLCSEPCFTAFKFVNHIFTDQCRWCNKYFVRKSAESYTIYSDEAAHCFCTKACMNVYISNSRHIVPCNWCKVKKYNFDMIKRTLDNGQAMMMCSLNCLTLYQVSVNAVSSKRIKCDQCKRTSQAQYHLTMSDATVRNFCTYQCVMSFQGQYSKAPLVMEGEKPKQQAVPTGAPRRTLALQRNSAKSQSMKMMDQRSGLPVIASVQSLATPAVPLAPLPTSHGTRGKSKRLSAQDRPARVPTPPPVIPPKPVTPPPPPKPQIYNHVITKTAPLKEVKNKGTSTKPIMISKGVTCRPHPCTKECQTEEHLQVRILIPIPVPIYVPVPMVMYSAPFPIPTPIPLPIPVPVFIPTTRNSATGIMKEIKKIHEKMPTDPFEAELLMMAEMVAGEKKKVEESSDSEEENGADDGFSPDVMDTGNSAFGEDVLQMALKMATEYEEPAVDLESAMTASTITPSSHPNMPPGGLDENNPMHHHQLMMLEQQRAAAAAAANSRKRTSRTPAPPAVPAPAITAPRTNKRSRRQADPPQPAQHHQMPEPMREPIEKPDANMCLKYTFGVNAWKQWVITKNAEMEKSTVRRKPFKPEILQLTADELNYSLCLFVKEVRKPNGSEYAPDTIYYLVLGIQQYLFENGRIDNIFTDSYYEKFTECLDEVARKFSVLYNDSQYIVTRVEEEHLWESKQLGAHSPHVLLSTLMFFNTKHFNLVTVEEHMQLSFSHIMKHWKRNPNQPGAGKIPGSRNVLLRFYPPQSALEANSRKKKVYEQHDNEENPLRCPVKLYEFYLSKCPESVKTRNDVFYLMPERSCVPDSPVWYSTQALGREPLSKMLHRVKMVKEINIALLTS